MTIEVSLLSKIFNRLDPGRVRSRAADPGMPVATACKDDAGGR